jgi:SprT protein
LHYLPHATARRKAGTTAAGASAKTFPHRNKLPQGMDKINSVLQRYLPAGTAEIFTDWIYRYRIHLHITRSRTTKAGDYRGPTPADPHHRISINHNLNPYGFLITLAHELAHRVVFEKYGHRAKPHGKEWKLEFQKTMMPFLTTKVFPADLLPFVTAHMENVSASNANDMELSRALRKYDTGSTSKLIFVEDLKEGALFRIGSKRVFKKGPLMRKRYRCECADSRKIYLVNGNAQVTPLE